jgi:cellulose synthase/poly-beta-1,6-N-acetylglucosamine synthase-like glycosyltransferase
MNASIPLAYNIFQYLVFALLALPMIYIFIFAFAGLFYRQVNVPVNPVLRKIAVLIPGYKEDEVIVGVAEDAIRQDYPKDFFEIIIIADSFRPQTLEALKAIPVSVIEVQFEKSTKSKALNAALAQLPDAFDLVVVLDADNLMAPGFLEKINAVFESGTFAVQGHRTAKNLDSPLALLDAISEEINNHIFRKGHRVLGLSSAIIGSGMAFRYDYFKRMMATVTAVGGFDKEIELKMLQEGLTIEYLDDAIVLDEKVQKADAFSNQRRRWLSAQFTYFRTDFGKSLTALFRHGNIDYFDKTLQFIQPPRILLLGAVLLFGALFSMLDLFMEGTWGPVFPWLILWIACILTFLFSIPLRFYRWQTISALGNIPGGMLLMIVSLLKIRGANKEFLHTRHNTMNTRL